MRRGIWHQFGDRSQKLVEEQLQQNNGVGVIISPRDLSFENAEKYAASYRALGASILIDQQFYNPVFTNEKLASYPTNGHRTTLSQLTNLSDPDVVVLARALEQIHRRVGATGVIAPALAYEAGRPDIARLNRRLFNTAKAVGDQLGLPTYATIILGRSSTASVPLLLQALSEATGLDANGWYYGFEFDGTRVPFDPEAVFRCCLGGLTLAGTGHPVLHCYAGLMSLLSFAFGATGSGIGHSQNTWQFTIERWQPTEGQGGAGNAPPRFFSSNLWGTIVYPDETARLPAPLRNPVFTHTVFSDPVRGNLPWKRWEANKHLVNLIGTTVGALASSSADPRTNAAEAVRILTGAVQLHAQIAQSYIFLTDETNSYQANWLTAIQRLLREQSSDFDYLSLIR